MNKKKLYWLFQGIGWSFYVLVNTVVASITVADGQVVFMRYVPLLAEAIVFFSATHFFRFIIKKYRWIALPMSILTLRIIIVSLIIGLPIYLIRVGVSFTLDMYNPGLLSVGFVVGNALPNALVVFIWSLFYFIYHYFEKYNVSLKHEASFRQMELENLKSQLNPHFIFNSLNSIRALIDENPNKSKQAITQLSNIMRKSLDSDHSRLIPFEQEIETVKDYLSLEGIRYEERLRIKLEIDSDSYRFYVPPMMIQTLVENGIKHGISKLKNGGELILHTEIIGNLLLIKILNSGHYNILENQKNKQGGLGIKNTIKRLQLIFGQEATLSIANNADQQVITQVTVPQIQHI